MAGVALTTLARGFRNACWSRAKVCYRERPGAVTALNSSQRSFARRRSQRARDVPQVPFNSDYGHARMSMKSVFLGTPPFSLKNTLTVAPVDGTIVVPTASLMKPPP